MPSAKQQPSNMKHGGGIRPNVWVLTFGPLCINTSFQTVDQLNFESAKLKNKSFSIMLGNFY